MTLKRISRTMLATLVLSGFCATAGADPILFGPVAPPPATPGHGLRGEYYNQSADNNAQADAVIALPTPPDGTFLSTLVDYPNATADVVGDSTTVSAFLGVDAGPLTGGGANNLVDSVWRYSGYIKILSEFDNSADSGINVLFSVGSDDGFRLNIGGTTVTTLDGLRPFGFSSGTADFLGGPGLYAIDLIFYENGGATGIELYSSIPGGPDSGAPSGTVGIVPTSVLYTSIPVAQIPEPATFLLLGVGLAALARKRFGEQL